MNQFVFPIILSISAALVSCKSDEALDGERQKVGYERLTAYPLYSASLERFKDIPKKLEGVLLAELGG